METDLGKLRLNNYHQDLKTGEVSNNGHSLKLSPPPVSSVPSMSGAGLQDKYIFAQFHLHWGNSSSEGSEHTVNGESYPLELHLVHYNSKYPDIGESLQHEDGLAVLGILFTLSSSDNPGLQPLIESVTSVKQAKNKTKLSKSLSLKSLLPDDLDTFYRYFGSLTTPTCNEIVTWTLLHQMMPVSEMQLRQLRSLKDSMNYNLGNNYR